MCTQSGKEDDGEWVRKPILSMKCQSLKTMRFILWSGQLDQPDMMLIASNDEGEKMEPLAFSRFHSENI